MSNAHITGKRPERTPLHKQNELLYEDNPGFYRRLVNDSPGRIEKFKRAGYKVVADAVDLSHDRDQKETEIGSVTRRKVNDDPLAPASHGVVMEIPLEWYLEDQREKQKRNDYVESQTDPHKKFDTENGINKSQFTVNNELKRK